MRQEHVERVNESPRPARSNTNKDLNRTSTPSLIPPDE